MTSERRETEFITLKFTIMGRRYEQVQVLDWADDRRSFETRAPNLAEMNELERRESELRHQNGC